MIAGVWTMTLAAAMSYGDGKAQAEPVTVDYVATVIEVAGASSGEFVVGDSILLTYTVDPASEDTNANPDIGNYPNGQRSAALVSPRLDRAWNSAGGTVMVYNDLLSAGVVTDRVFFWGRATGSLGGRPMYSLEVWFMHDAEAGETPRMIESDALPLVPLQAPVFAVKLTTDTDFTIVYLQAEPLAPTDPVLALLEEARGAIAGLRQSPNTAPAAGRTLVRLVDPIESAYAAADIGLACRELDHALAQLDLLVRIRRVSAVDTANLRDILAEVDSELGCGGG